MVGNGRGLAGDGTRASNLGAEVEAHMAMDGDVCPTEQLTADGTAGYGMEVALDALVTAGKPAVAELGVDESPRVARDDGE